MRAAHQLAVENLLIKAEMVDLSQFPYLGSRYQVQGVPLTIIDDSIKIPGALSAGQLLDRITK